MDNGVCNCSNLFTSHLWPPPNSRQDVSDAQALQATGSGKTGFKNSFVLNLEIKKFKVSDNLFGDVLADRNRIIGGGLF